MRKQRIRPAILIALLIALALPPIGVLSFITLDIFNLGLFDMSPELIVSLAKYWFSLLAAGYLNASIFGLVVGSIVALIFYLFGWVSFGMTAILAVGACLAGALFAAWPDSGSCGGALDQTASWFIVLFVPVFVTSSLIRALIVALRIVRERN